MVKIEEQKFLQKIDTKKNLEIRRNPNFSEGTSIRGFRHKGSNPLVGKLILMPFQKCILFIRLNAFKKRVENFLRLKKFRKNYRYKPHEVLNFREKKLRSLKKNNRSLPLLFNPRVPG